MSVEERQGWVTETVAVYATSDRVVRVRGDDARSWLNGQISNDVRSLTGDSAVYATQLTVKGRIVSDLWALDDPPGMALVLPSARLAQALARFEQHIIMEDVELEQADGLRVITLQGPRASELACASVRRYACARLGGQGFDLWVEREHLDGVLAELGTQAQALGGGSLDDADWSALHLALAVPRLDVDFGEDTYPQEAGLGKRALSFHKGCYTGQEVVYMLENRGQLARRLVQLELGAAAEAGAQVSDADGKKLGALTSLDREGKLALGFVKRSHAEPEQTVWVAGSPARVRGVVGG